MKDKLVGKKYTSRNGFSVVEILIALAVLIFTTSAVILVTFGSQNMAVDTETNNEALLLARTQMEEARATARNSFSSIVDRTVSVNSGPLTYTKNLAVRSIDAYTKQVTSTVSWISGGRNLSVALSTIFTDISSSIGGIVCNPTITGDWSNPQAYPFDSANDLAAQATGNNSNGLGIADVKVYRQKMYIAANYTANDGRTFYIFNLATNPRITPTYLGRATTTARSGDSALKAVTLGPNGNRLYAYVANAINFNFSNPACTNTTCPQFQVIDVTDPANPNLITTGNLKMPVMDSPNNSCGANCQGDQGTGKTIFYDNDYVYVGLVKPNSGPEFNIIDVHDPIHPVRVGGYTVGRTVESIFVEGNFAYLTTDDNASGNKQLLVLDVSNKSLDPVPVATYFDAPGIGYGRSAQIMNNKIYFGRSYSTSPNFYVFDGTMPFSSPLGAPLGSIITGTSDSVDALTVRDTLAFTLISNTTLSNSRFQVLNLAQSGYPAYGSVTLQSIVAQLQGLGNNFSGSSALSCTGNYFYTALQTNGNNKDILAVIGPYVPSSSALSNSGNLTIAQGSTGITTLINTATSGFPPATTLSISPSTPLPTGATAAFSNNHCVPTCSIVLTITTSAITPIGTYPITIIDGTTATTFDLTVNSSGFDYSLFTAPNPTTVLRAGSSVSNTITVTMTNGSPQNVTITPDTSLLPAGTTMTPSSASCTPNPAAPYQCSVQFNFSATASSATGTVSVPMNGNAPSHSTNLTLNVTPPPFAYSITNQTSLTMQRNGPPATLSVMVTMIPGAVPQLVTLTPPRTRPANQMPINPYPGSCTPSPTPPYECSVDFIYSAVNGPNNSQSDSGQYVSGSPSNIHGTLFTITVNP